jgi:hypothetical protein
MHQPRTMVTIMSNNKKPEINPAMIMEEELMPVVIETTKQFNDRRLEKLKRLITMLKNLQS